MTVVLGVLFAGYLVLGGLDYGAGILGRGEAVRGLFIGNQVWLVAAMGVAMASKPSISYAAVSVAVLGAAMVMAAYGMSLFSTGQYVWLARVGSVLAVAGWGFALASWAGAIALLALTVVHGWAFVRRWWIVLPLTSAAIAAGVFWAGSRLSFRQFDLIADLKPLVYAVIPLVVVLQAVSWVLAARADHFAGQIRSEIAG